jgi:DNA-binding response OmpR family regulator
MHLSIPTSILVIEQEPIVSDLIREALVTEGYRAIAAPNLDLAVHLLATLRINLVITNYMDSRYRRGDRWPILELFRHLAPPDTRIIVLTDSTYALAQEAQALGVADLIAKPFDLADLLQRVARAIGSLQVYSQPPIDPRTGHPIT